MSEQNGVESKVREIRRKTRKRYSAEEKIRIVLEGLRGEERRRGGKIENPSAEVIYQVLAVLADDNIYYDARILASKALIALLENTRDGFRSEMNEAVKKVTERLMAPPQPPYFDDAIMELFSKIEPLSA